MDIDNSRAQKERTCPMLYYNSYERNGTGLELKPKIVDKFPADELGSRIHELLQERYDDSCAKYPASPNEALEKEAQWIMSEYNRHWQGDNPGKIIAVEKTFQVPLPPYCPLCYKLDCVETDGESEAHCSECDVMFPAIRHHYNGKIDLIFQPFESEYLDIMDHKSEKRGAKSNSPQKWAARDQATLYLWAARQIFGKPIRNFWVNVLTRPSEAGQIGPTFPERQKLERSQEQIDIAVRDLVIEADRIEGLRKVFGDKRPWPSSKEQCLMFGQCEFYQPCTFGWDDVVTIAKYQPKTEYLEIPK